jgi:hypothetical protein
MHDELTTLPGVGPAIAADLRHLGIHSIRELAESNPEQLFQRLQKITGHEQEPCLLYTFRCATYAARTLEPQPDLLKWWNWKDRRLDD